MKNTFLNPNFLKTELILNKEYIIVDINKEKQNITKKKLININKINSKESELIFENKSILVDTGDLSTFDNKIGKQIIVFQKDDNYINMYLKLILTQIISIGLEKSEKEYLNQINKIMTKIKKLII